MKWTCKYIGLTLVISMMCSAAGAATYYVDFDGGSNSAAGTSPNTAWKHSPGDSAATGIPASKILAPGDTVTFKGGVHYRGSIIAPDAGNASAPITFDGNTANTFGQGKAVIDGSQLITGWTACTSAADCGGNPNWQQIYKADIPGSVNIFTANLYDGEQLLTLAQGPNLADPFFYDDISTYRSVPAGNVTKNSLIDAAYFTQSSSDAWNGAYIHMWVNPNVVISERITGYIPAEHKILYDWTTSSPGPYTDRNTLYAMGNHHNVLDTPGEYVIDEDNDKVYLWPLDSDDINQKQITVTLRINGFDFAGKSYVTLQGFKIIKFSAGFKAWGNGCGVRNNASASHIIIRDNEVAFNKSMEKYGGIYLASCSSGTVENNYIHHNARSRGLMYSGSNGMAVNNHLYKNGGTGIYFAGTNGGEIRGNTVELHYGTHANGITLYQDCTNVLVIANISRDGNIALTTQNAHNLTIAYNLLIYDGDGYTYADWGGSDNLKLYNNTVINQYGKSTSVSSSSVTGLVAQNNIFDGFGVQNSNIHHNLYTSLLWNQAPQYGWSLPAGSIIQQNKNLVYVDPANEDYHLKDGSPAVDAGLDVGLSADIEGKIVPIGPAVDFGAYEYGQTGPRIVAANVFYNNSVFDGNNPVANAEDDNAIAPDKVPLKYGQTATFANYTSYDKGINGIIIDMADLVNPPAIGASDFELTMGEDNPVYLWTPAPTPMSITVRQGAGVDGSDRITLIFADGSIRKKWLNVKVLPTASTGLAEADSFFFGNAIGDTGDLASNAIVDATDEIASRNHPKHFVDPAMIDNKYDFNRDGKVDATDQIIARNNVTNMTNALILIAP